jgi:hypothetical protein
MQINKRNQNNSLEVPIRPIIRSKTKNSKRIN